MNYSCENVIDSICKIYPTITLLPDGTKITRSIICIDTSLNIIRDKRVISYCLNVHKVNMILQNLLSIIDTNIGTMYQAINRAWKHEKQAEMLSFGLCYIIYSDDHKMPLCFQSITLTNDLQISSKIIYLYEIQLISKIQSFGLGKKLMNWLFNVTRDLNLPEIQLTVFSCNEAALCFYTKLNFIDTSDSPMDRQLRNRVVKPIYYLKRWVNRHAL